MNHYIAETNSGYIALISMIIIASVVLVVGTSVGLLGIVELQNSLTLRKGHEAFAVNESCMEYALLNLKNDSSYDPKGSSVTVDELTCDSVDVKSAGQDQRVITTENAVEDPSGTFFHTLEVTVNTEGNNLEIVSWYER